MGRFLGDLLGTILSTFKVGRVKLDTSAATAQRVVTFPDADLNLGAAFQANNANLTALAGLTGAANKGAYFTAAGAMSLYDLTVFGRSLGGVADDAAARSLIGADNASNLTSGTLADARISKSGPTSPSLVNSFTNGGGCRYWKVAGVVFVHVDVDRATTPAGNLTMFTLPVGFRPPVQLYTTGSYGQSSPLVIGLSRVGITTGGAVQHIFSVSSTVGASGYNMAALFAFPEA